MTALIRLIFPDFEPAATVENLGATPVPAPAVDLDQFDAHLEDLFDRGQERIEAGEVAGVDPAA